MRGLLSKCAWIWGHEEAVDNDANDRCKVPLK
jgi:hypothetical protein